MRRLVLCFMLVLGLTTSGLSQATLIDRGNGLIYDDVLNITWLQNAAPDGSRTWDQAVVWADGLVFEGYDDWRLPSMDLNGDQSIVDCSTASEVDCRDNEFGYMYYRNLGGTKGDDLTGDQGLIQNIQIVYWSETEFVPNLAAAWVFDFDLGEQYELSKVSIITSWAVRPGDVFTVPEPPTTLLFTAALLGLFGLNRWCNYSPTSHKISTFASS